MKGLVGVGVLEDKHSPSRQVGWWYFKETKLHEQRCIKLTSSSATHSSFSSGLVSMNRAPPTTAPHHHH